MYIFLGKKVNISYFTKKKTLRKDIKKNIKNITTSGTFQNILHLTELFNNENCF